MPEKDGFDTAVDILDMLKEQNLDKQCILIANSGLVDESQIKKGQKVGIHYFLQKPLQIEDLKQLMKNLIIKGSI